MTDSYSQYWWAPRRSPAQGTPLNVLGRGSRGVQPLGKIKQFWKSRTFRININEVKMDNNKYRGFLRLNNRKKYQKRQDFEEAGYFISKIPASSFTQFNTPGNSFQTNVIVRSEWRDWCRKNVPDHEYVITNFGVVFVREDVKILFDMIFMGEEQWAP